jgi:pentatricopeptide repeat protein
MSHDRPPHALWTESGSAVSFPLALSSPAECLALSIQAIHRGEFQLAEYLVAYASQELQATTSTFHQVITEHSVAGNLSGTEKFLCRLMASGFRPNVETLTAMISNFAEIGDFEGSHRWFQLALQETCELEESMVNALIHAHCQAGDILGAEGCLNIFMSSREESNFTVSLIGCCNMFIQACCRRGCTEKALSWASQAIALGHNPTLSTFCILLATLAGLGDSKGMEQCAALMVSQSLPMSCLTYSQLWRACTRQGDSEIAEKHFCDIVALSDSPLTTFNAMIHGCAQNGDMQGAEKLIEMMERSGVEPCTITYNNIINICAIVGDTAGAKVWLDRMVVKGVELNAVTFATFCKAFARQGDVAAVQQIMRVLEADGQPLNEYFFASLISACGRKDPPDIATAESAFAEFVRRGFKVQRVKHVLAQVVGEQRVAQLFAQAAVPIKNPVQTRAKVQKSVASTNGMNKIVAQPRPHGDTSQNHRAKISSAEAPQHQAQAKGKFLFSGSSSAQSTYSSSAKVPELFKANGGSSSLHQFGPAAETLPAAQSATDHHLQNQARGQTQEAVHEELSQSAFACDQFLAWNDGTRACRLQF